MSSQNTVFDYENVNGVKLTLTIDSGSGSANSRHFMISFKNEKNKSSWPKKSLFFAILFNILAFAYIRISLTAILVIIIVLSFLVFFWITHSVQSESLLIIPSVGIQSSVQFVCGREDNFVAWPSIDDVIINEVIKLNRVLYYLTVLVKAGNPTNQEMESVKLLPLFKYTKPRLAMLEKIYSELQNLLTAAQKGDASKCSGDVG